MTAIAGGEPVTAIGGFNGTDATPTLAQFKSYVTAGKIHYFVAGGTGGNSGTSSQITTWGELQDRHDRHHDVLRPHFANARRLTVGTTRTT